MVWLPAGPARPPPGMPAAAPLAPARPRALAAAQAGLERVVALSTRAAATTRELTRADPAWAGPALRHPYREDLKALVAQQYGGEHVSIAFLKLVEVLALIGAGPAAPAYSALCVAELPGAFVEALRLLARRRGAELEWCAQSLRAPGAFGDEFGLIRRFPRRWDFGPAGDGDLAAPANLEHYMALRPGGAAPRALASGAAQPRECRRNAARCNTTRRKTARHKTARECRHKTARECRRKTARECRRKTARECRRKTARECWHKTARECRGVKGGRSPPWRVRGAESPLGD